MRFYEFIRGVRRTHTHTHIHTHTHTHSHTPIYINILIVRHNYFWTLGVKS